MNQIKSIIFLAGTFLLYSCQPPEGSGIKNIIEGYIYYDCDMLPFANKDLVLFETYASSMGGNTTGGDLAYATTDSTGHFRFEYNAENEYEVLIKTDAGYGIIGLPIDIDIHDVVAYYNPTCNIQVSLNVINSYSETDTLFITDLNNLGHPLHVPGPFASGLLYLSSDFPMLGLNYYGSTQNFGYNINEGEWTTEWIEIDVELNVCDTTFVTVDIQ